MDSSFIHSTLHSPAEKHNQLAQILREKARQPIVTCPLSYNQKSLWFLHQLAPASWAYNTLFAARILSNIDRVALRRSLQALLDRHAILRTTYTVLGSKPVQQVPQYEEVCFNERNVSTWSWEDLNKLLTEEAQRPFDLERGPVLRTHLFSRSTQDHLLLLTGHHIALDFWSYAILIEELFALYAAEIAGVRASLAPPERQYVDFVRWQNDLASSAAGEYLWSYWQKQLGGELPLLDLPTDRPRSQIQAFRGASHPFQLREDLVIRLKAMAKAERTTLYTILLATFQVLLYRYSGQKDILVGSPMAGRSRLEFARVVGDFMNMVALRGDLSGNPTFRQLLTQVHTTVLDALDHQDLPFSLLVERLVPNRDPSRSPVFDVMFALESSFLDKQGISQFIMGHTDERIELGGLLLEPVHLTQQEGQYDLTLHMFASIKGAITGVLQYNTALYDASTTAHMLEHFQTLLEAVVDHPEYHLSDLPLMNEEERHQVLVEWNATRADYPHQLCIHELFEEQVSQTPDRIALVVQGEKLTYGELNRRANQLAHYLRDIGVGPEVLVGICLHRSPEMVIALLGILKAGGAYVPLDTSLPKERLSYMLADADIHILLTRQQVQFELPEHNVQVIYLDTEQEQIAMWPVTNVQGHSRPDHAAYVLYTSGSTGLPKGVVVEHHGVVNFLHAMHKRLAVTPQDVFLAVTTLSFDIAALELLLPLVAGASVEIVSHDVAADGVRLIEALATSHATFMQGTPATWRLLLAAGWQGSARLNILCGGEALSAELAGQLVRKGRSCWNLYGPTETTIYSAVEHITSTDRTPNIGRPIANTQIYLLDASLQPVPVGVPGELYIGGVGVARGYLKRPELTAERFIANPFDTASYTRLYQTGDLARYLADGSIEYIGRLDHQVKVRGYRIELSEIEAVLNQYTGIQRSAVVARSDALEDKRLVAYVIAEKQASLSSNTVRQFLKERLPEYMLPTAFVFLDAFPATSNGKLDRRALPAPDKLNMKLGETYIVPRDSVELRLVQIWEDLLHLRSIGVTDNFFDLGGHSLLAVQLVAQIENVFGQSLPLSTLFQKATVEDLAVLLRQQHETLPRTSLVSIHKKMAGTRPPFFCVHPVSGEVLCYSDLARHLGEDQPFFGLQAIDADNETERPVSIESMAARYIEELRGVQPHGPYHLGGWSMGGVIAFEMARQLHGQDEEVALLALLDTHGLQHASIEYDDTLTLVQFAQDLGNLCGTPLAVAYADLQKWSLDEQVAYILDQARRVHALPPHSGLTVMQRLLRVFKANIYALHRYVPDNYSGCITLLQARDSVLMAQGDPMPGWAALATKGVEVYTLPGNHYSILRSPQVESLAQCLRTCIARSSVSIGANT